VRYTGTMRILHTSDWHLGRTLHGRSRSAEHEAFLDELVELAREVDLVLVSGDVFESTNPPIDAEQLYFDALARLGDGGRRGVVVIAGNHDSPDRLRASAPVCERHGVWVLGRPGDLPAGREMAAGGVRLVGSAPSTLKLDLPSGERAVVVAVPYPSEARLARLLSPSLDERDLQAAYERRVSELFEELCAASFEPGAVNLLTSHLAVRSCMPSPSERALIGGAWQVAGDKLPASPQYIALGHLHLAQQVPDAPTLARYAGSPLAMRFSERDHPRAHVVVDVSAGRRAEVELVRIAAGRPLVVWQAESAAAVEAGIREGLYPDALIDLEVRSTTPLTHTELGRLKRLPRDFVRIRAALPEAVVQPLIDPARRRELPISELFGAFYREQTGREPSRELIELVLELTAPVGADERAAG
jgi:DNA repair protein SbcD/Mre11